MKMIYSNGLKLTRDYIHVKVSAFVVTSGHFYRTPGNGVATNLATKTIGSLEFRWY